MDAIFAFVWNECEVTIFGTTPVVAVVAINHVVGNVEPFFGDAQLLSGKLLEEGFFEVEIAAVIERVPSVAFPIAVMVNGEGFVGGINGNHRFARKVALAGVEAAFISETHAALTAAHWAKFGRRDEEFFAVKCGRHFLVKLEIFVRDRELLITVEALVLHGASLQ